MKLIKRHIAKTFTWRLLASLDTFISVYFITGSFQNGISIGLIEIFSKSILYFFHERIWYNSAFSNALKRHVLKTFSWRFIGTIDTILISYLITGIFFEGVKIGIIEIITKMFLYYFHERLWYRINFDLKFKRKHINE